MRFGKRIEQWPPQLRDAVGTTDLTNEQRRALGRLAGWAEHEGLGLLDLATIEAFADYLESTLLPRRCQSVMGDLVLALAKIQPNQVWDWLRSRRRAIGRLARAQGADAQTPEKPDKGKKKIFSLPINLWPETYRKRWQAAIDPGISADEFDEFPQNPGPFAGLPGAYRGKLTAAWGMLFKVAVDTGISPSLTPALIKTFLASLRVRKVRPRTAQAYLERLEHGAKALEPGLDLCWLRPEWECFRRQARKQPKVKDGRVVPGDMLLALGLTLCALARELDPASVSEAVMFRDGVIIALLTIAPARVENFAGIEIGRHFDLSERPGHLVFSAAETKEKRPEVFPIWPEIRELIDEYIARYRKTLMDGYDGDRLWLTEHGGRGLSSSGLRARIKYQTLKYLGVDVTPHLFRDSFAVTVSERAPGEMDLVTRMLHHASAISTRNYRDQASTIAAADQAQAIVEADRHEQAREVRRRRIHQEQGEADEVFMRFA